MALTLPFSTLKIISVMALALFAMAFAITVPAIATDFKTAEEIAKELRGRKKRSGPQISAEAAATLKEFKDLRHHRGPTMQEREKVYQATKGLPQVNLLIYFEFDSDKLAPDGIAALKELAKALGNYELRYKSYLIVGHTDAKGTPQYNLDLSTRRADVVKRFLVEGGGIDPEALTTMGCGFEKLANSEDPYAAENRRVQMVRTD